MKVCLKLLLNPPSTPTLKKKKKVSYKDLFPSILPFCTAYKMAQALNKPLTKQTNKSPNIYFLADFQPAVYK